MYHQPMTEPKRRQPRRPNGAPSSQLRVTLDPELHDAARAKAAERGETLSAAVVDMLRGYVDR